MARSIQALFVPPIGVWLLFIAAQHVAAQQAVTVPDEPIPIADLGIENQVRSAIDLIGPENGPAGRGRAELVRRLQCWIDGHGECAGADLNDSRVRAIRRFLVHGPLDQAAAVSIDFPDRTRIQVRLTRASNLDPNDWASSVYTLAVVPETAQAPGLAAVPSRPADFTGFSYDGSPAVRDALQRLRQRLQSDAPESSH